jgi:hypothetical protein
VKSRKPRQRIFAKSGRRDRAEGDDEGLMRARQEEGLGSSGYICYIPELLVPMHLIYALLYHSKQKHRAYV